MALPDDRLQTHNIYISYCVSWFYASKLKHYTHCLVPGHFVVSSVFCLLASRNPLKAGYSANTRHLRNFNDGAGFKMANSNEDFIKHSFWCGLRGFHVYNEIWKPIVGELLRCSHERNNIYDRYAIAANKRLRGYLADSIIGHLPREISRATRFFLLRGGMVHLKVTDENYRRSPLMQGGLEIPVEVICEMDDTPRNRAIMERYKTLHNTRSRGRMLNLTTVQRMYWRNCAKMITQMPKKNLSRMLTLINI